MNTIHTSRLLSVCSSFRAKAGIFFCLLGLLTNVHLMATGVRGTVRDQAGLPLAFASVFVPETGAGVVTNNEGDYAISLPPGAYTLVFQFLGYQTASRAVNVGTPYTELDVVLQPQSYQLKQVELSANGEDPAYTVMRKAIAKATYHAQQVETWQAKAYIKGTGKLDKIPRMFSRQLAGEGVDTSMAYTMESISLLTYQRPNTFKEQVLSIYTQGDDQGTSPMGYLNSSFYEEEVASSVSPLAPNAFNFYTFSLEGYFADGDYLINKIKVVPRSPGDQVFTGYLYIVDDYWSIHSLDLTTSSQGVGITIEQIYTPLQQVAWMPVTATYDFTIELFGFDFTITYLASLSDYQLTLNPDLPRDIRLIDEQIDATLARELKESARENPEHASAKQRLYTGAEVSRKELRQLMRALAKEERKQAKSQSEQAPVVADYTLEVDSNAYDQDTAFWARSRPVPLTDREVRSYAIRDSIARAKGEVARADSSTSAGRFDLGDLLLGARWELADGQTLAYESPLLHWRFNPLEGYNATGSLVYAKQNGDRRIEAGGQGRYGLAWKRFYFKGHTALYWGDESAGHQLRVAGGRYLEQLNGGAVVSEAFNTLYTMLAGQNYVYMYQKEYARLAYTRQWSATASLQLGVEWANRRQFRNFNTDRTLFSRWEEGFGSNLPFTANPADYPDWQKAALLDLILELRPWQKYELRNGQRIPSEEYSPTIKLAYRGGLPGLIGSESDFAQLDFTYRQTLLFTGRGKLDLKANAGAFLKHNNVMLADRKHFPGTEMVFTSLDPVGTYRLLPYYTYSTQQYYLGAAAHYQFRKLALTQIGSIRLLGLKENVFLNYLSTPEVSDYVELGYGLDNILRFLRLEVVANYYDGQYQGAGVRIGIASNLGGRFLTFNQN